MWRHTSGVRPFYRGFGFFSATKSGDRIAALQVSLADHFVEVLFRDNGYAEALGFFERVAESAVQYAVRLLGARTIHPQDKDNNATAHRLVYSYKDHGFVIDSREASEIFGQEIVVTNSDEYRLSNALFGIFDFGAWVVNRRFTREFSYVGGHRQGCMVWTKASG